MDTMTKRRKRLMVAAQVDAATMAALQDRARAEDRSVSAVLRRLIAAYLAEPGDAALPLRGAQ